MKTLAELKTENTVNFVTIVHVAHLDYPYYYVNNEYLGYAEYSDISVFDPFAILGFDKIIINISVNENYKNQAEAEAEIEETIETPGIWIMTVLKELGLKKYITIDVE